MIANGVQAVLTGPVRRTAIPLVKAQEALILEIQTEPWWIGVNVRLLERVRLQLRELVQHVEKTKQPLIYSNFEDELGAGAEVTLPQVGVVDFKRFKHKARHFLLEHQDNLALLKLNRGKPLTPTDLQQLEALTISAGVGDRAQFEHAVEALHRASAASSALWWASNAAQSPRPSANSSAPQALLPTR